MERRKISTQDSLQRGKEQTLAASETASQRVSLPDRLRERTAKEMRSLLGGTNLDCKNLITVQTCVRAVTGKPLRRGSDKCREVRNKRHRAQDP